MTPTIGSLKEYVIFLFEKMEQESVVFYCLTCRTRVMLRNPQHVELGYTARYRYKYKEVGKCPYCGNPVENGPFIWDEDAFDY